MKLIPDMNRRPEIERAVTGALRSAIAAHGDITVANAPSAAKRVIGALKQYARNAAPARPVPPILNGWVVGHRKGWRFIPRDKVAINRNTPVGEDADFYEVMPHDGRRLFRPFLEIRGGSVVYCNRRTFADGRWSFTMPHGLQEFLEAGGVTVPPQLEDGTVMLVWKDWSVGTEGKS